MRTTRLAAAAVAIGAGIALRAVSASAQTARDVKGPELARALRPQKRENLMYFKAVDVAGVRLFYREAGDPSKPAIVLLIFQNFTLTEKGWNPERLKVYERLGGPETPEKLAETEQLATVQRAMFLHKTGARQPDALNPDNWAIDAYAFSIPESRVFMSRLFMDLSTNIAHFPEWTAYLKDRQPKTLIVWGRNDPLRLPAAAEFVKQAVPAADLRYFDGGHFVLDEYADAIAEAIVETFSR
jgi:hypothetical protein